MHRRAFTNMLGLTAAAAATAGAVATSAGAQTAPGPVTAADGPPPFRIGMIMFEQMTNLDLVGPLDMLSRVRQAKVHLLHKTLDPVTTDSGTRVLPDLALRDAPPLDMIFLPGGPGTSAVMEDEEVIGFLRDRAPQAQWVTSVCTGALILGSAGLLRGYKAATHWRYMDILPILGAEAVNERVVIDRNRATGGGVTAGIDFALTIIATIWGREQAELIQLGNEYNPQPPFNAGSPETAPAAVVERFRTLSTPIYDARRAAATRAVARLG